MKKVFLFLCFVGLIIAIRFSPLGSHVTFENFHLQKEFLKTIVQQNYFLAALLFVLIYAVSTALSVPGAALLTMAGGLLFGILPAVLYVNIGATTGATGAFLVSRYLIGTFIQQRYADKLAWLNHELRVYGHTYLLVLRLIPIFPFFLINVCAGLTRIRFETFTWTTAIGIIPGSFLFVFAGKQLDYVTKPADVFSGKIVLAFLLLASVALVPMVIKKIRSKGVVD